MAERPLSAVLQSNQRVKMRGVSPVTPQRLLTADDAGGIMDVVQVHADAKKPTKVELQFANQGPWQQVTLPSGPGGRIHLNDHLA